MIARWGCVCGIGVIVREAHPSYKSTHRLNVIYIYHRNSVLTLSPRSCFFASEQRWGCEESKGSRSVHKKSWLRKRRRTTTPACLLTSFMTTPQCSANYAQAQADEQESESCVVVIHETVVASLVMAASISALYKALVYRKTANSSSKSLLPSRQIEFKHEAKTRQCYMCCKKACLVAYRSAGM